jgi:hypothetical protein
MSNMLTWAEAELRLAGYDDEDQESESQAFDFGPKDLAWLFGEKLGIYMTEA